MNQTNTLINFKSKAWRHTPPKAFLMNDFILKTHDQNSGQSGGQAHDQNGDQSGGQKSNQNGGQAHDQSGGQSGGQKNYFWGIGPSESQFQAVAFEDLRADGFIQAHDALVLPENDKIKRAALDSILEQHIHRQNHQHNHQHTRQQNHQHKEESIKLINPLPTTAWLNANTTPTKFSMTLDQGVRQSFCFFESNQQEGLSGQLKLHLKEGSELNLGLHLNSEHKSYRQFNFIVEKGAKLNLFSLFSGESAYKRLEIRVFLVDEETSVHINGLSLSKSHSVFDFHSDIFHLNKNQKTTQIYRSLNQDKGHSIFSGCMHLTEDAANAQVKQLNNNLLLNEKSRVNTQPELNIYQNNVKASHGATTGSLDKDHFFYFRSRGFKLNQAKKMLLEGFCLEPLNCIEDTGLKSYFKNRITEEL